MGYSKVLKLFSPAAQTPLEIEYNRGKLYIGYIIKHSKFRDKQQFVLFVYYIFLYILNSNLTESKFQTVPS